MENKEARQFLAKVSQLRQPGDPSGKNVSLYSKFKSDVEEFVFDTYKFQGTRFMFKHMQLHCDIDVRNMEFVDNPEDIITKEGACNLNGIKADMIKSACFSVQTESDIFIDFKVVKDVTLKLLTQYYKLIGFTKLSYKKGDTLRIHDPNIHLTCYCLNTDGSSGGEVLFSFALDRYNKSLSQYDSSIKEIYHCLENASLKLKLYDSKKLFDLHKYNVGSTYFFVQVVDIDIKKQYQTFGEKFDRVINVHLKLKAIISIVDYQRLDYLHRLTVNLYSDGEDTVTKSRLFSFYTGKVTAKTYDNDICLILTKVPVYCNQISFTVELVKAFGDFPSVATQPTLKENQKFYIDVGFGFCISSYQSRSQKKYFLEQNNFSGNVVHFEGAILYDDTLNLDDEDTPDLYKHLQDFTYYNEYVATIDENGGTVIGPALDDNALYLRDQVVVSIYDRDVAKTKLTVHTGSKVPQIIKAIYMVYYFIFKPKKLVESVGAKHPEKGLKSWSEFNVGAFSS